MSPRWNTRAPPATPTVTTTAAPRSAERTETPAVATTEPAETTASYAADTKARTVSGYTAAEYEEDGLGLFALDEIDRLASADDPGALLDELEGHLPPLAAEAEVLGFSVPLELGSRDGELRLITTLTSLATAVDVTLAELHLEAFLPADDLTAEAVACAAGVPLVRDAASEAAIAAMFAARGRPMPEINKKQADLPAGCEVLPNPAGTAPGFAVALPAGFAEPLRLGARPVVGYLEEGRTLLNLRSLAPGDDDALTEAVLEVAEKWT